MAEVNTTKVHAWKFFRDEMGVMEGMDHLDHRDSPGAGDPAGSKDHLEFLDLPLGD